MTVFSSRIPPDCILMLVRAFAGGGAQRDAIELANGLFRAGWPVAILTLDTKGPLAARIDPQLPVVDLGKGRKLRMALAAPALVRCLHKLAPAALVTSEASGNVLGALSLRMLPVERRPRLVLREVASPLSARKADPFLQNRLAYALAPWTYPLADRVVTLTAGSRRDLATHFRVPPQKLVNLGTNAVMSEACLSSLSAPSTREPFLVLAIGRLSPEKDFLTLLDAFALMRTTRPGRLLILGEGPQRRALERRIDALDLADSVHMPGYVDDPTPYLRRAALFVSTSRYEGFGNAIVEALACGTPVVATDAPHGPRDILAAGRYGDLVPPGDAAGLARAMAAALRHPPMPDMLRARAAAFTTEQAVARFATMLSDLGLAPSDTRVLNKALVP